MDSLTGMKYSIVATTQLVILVVMDSLTGYFI